MTNFFQGDNLTEQSEHIIPSESELKNIEPGTLVYKTELRCENGKFSFVTTEFKIVKVVKNNFKESNESFEDNGEINVEMVDVKLNLTVFTDISSGYFLSKKDSELAFTENLENVAKIARELYIENHGE